MSKLNVGIRRSASTPTVSTPQSESSNQDQSTALISPCIATSPIDEDTQINAKDPDKHEEMELEADHKDAELELSRYEEAGVVCDMAERTMDLVRYWEVSQSTTPLTTCSKFVLICSQSKQNVYPLLFCVAMDVLPAQASSVPCERIFSSSKLTCTDSRNRLLPDTIEALQFLKFTYKQSRLNFTPDLIAEEVDYGISGHVTQRAVDELTKSGAVDELYDLYANETEENEY